MGHHFDPQFYLRGFVDDHTDSLWVYEKGKEAPAFLPIRRVAQEKKLYSEKVEKYLADKVEAPANEVLKKIRNNAPFSGKEKLTLARYIFLFYKRVPRARQRAKLAAPKIAADYFKGLNKSFENLKCEHPNRAKFYEECLRKAQKVLQEMADNPSDETWISSIPVFDEGVVTALSKMTWIFLTCKNPDIFLTNDNPVFIHSSLGIGKMRSELIFPISSNITLLANWWDLQDLGRVEANSSLIKEINRRIAFNAFRFIYGCSKRKWIITLLNKRRYEIHLFRPP